MAADVAVAWAFGCFGMGLVISSTSVLLLHLSAPEEAGTNSAALQISDGLSNVILLSRVARPSRRWAAVASATRSQKGPVHIPQPSSPCSCRWRGWRWWGPG
ncbi:hypothetical protein SALBM311S_04389 [Streptomyces alboniger]